MQWHSPQGRASLYVASSRSLSVIGIAVIDQRIISDNQAGLRMVCFALSSQLFQIRTHPHSELDPACAIHISQVYQQR
jgi:hypothetical protein